MNAAPLDWSYWRSFLAVVDQGSLSAAARLLQLTQPSVGRHIDALEEALGAKLFVRTPHGLSTTELAQSLVPHARQMASAAAAIERAASAQPHLDEGVVRLTASEMIGVEVLPPILSGFMREHPRVHIELTLSDRNVDLLRRDADLAVRMVRPNQAALVASRLGVVRIGLFAHRDYLESCGNPKSEAELAAHTLIGPEDEQRLAGMVVGGQQVTKDMFAYRTNGDLAQLAAVRTGVGIGVCQHGIARQDPSLVPVLPHIVLVQFEVWLAMHEDLRDSYRVRHLFEHLSLHLRRHLRA